MTSITVIWEYISKSEHFRGVTCRAFDRTLHSDCFQCSTCGSSLKNQGYHFINDKFYCDIHGHQLRGSGGVARRDEIHWSVAERSKMVPTFDKNTLLTPYHPEVTTRQSISISPTPWKTQSPISPSNRGVPPAATQYGHELNELRKEIYSSSMSSGNVSGQQSHQPSRMLLSRIRSLPLEVQKVTSPRRLPCKHHWPPASHKIMKYWQCSHLIATASNDSTSNKLEHYELSFPLSKFIRGNEDRRLKLPSPKQYHLMPCDTLCRNPNYLGHMKQQKCFSNGLNYYMEEKHKVEVKGTTNVGALNSRICSCDCGCDDCSTNNIEEHQQKQQHIQKKKGLLRTPQNTDYNTQNLGTREYRRKRHQKKEQNLDVDIETVHNSSNVKMGSLPIKEVHDSQTSPNGTESPNHTSQCDKIGNIDLSTSEKNTATEVEENFMPYDQGAWFPQDITVGDNEINKIVKGNRMTICGKWNLFDIHNEGRKVVRRSTEKVEERQRKSMASDLVEESGKQIVTESIARYQLELCDPEKGLSYMLKNAIDFLQNLDNMEDKLIDRNGSYQQQQENGRYLDTSKVIKIMGNQLNNCQDVNRNSYNKPSNVDEPQNELAEGRGILHAQSNRVSCCEDCKQEIRDAYVLANGLAYCPDHFVCSNKLCGRKLLDIGFVEEKGHKYCERCFETEIAPRCAKCNQPITADCLNALQKQWHPHCFACTYCHNPFGNSAFFLEQGQPYCETGKLVTFFSVIATYWNTLFTTKCVSCHYPIEAGDRWVEALGAAFHSTCFNCTSCNVNLEGESFYAKNGAPYCKLHA
ncbi:hypothetical protein WUBG_02635 [Wuchereria bancrofti]|uniref:LIM zinc-binding domain-containing protein n=1 Tax=Wuchereria bancrofti TaxID=6293 RepID=J9FGI5_WUCBA|nr:hypothetical protein WUBG_02635 [Wuchereria bancrofti]